MDYTAEQEQYNQRQEILKSIQTVVTYMLSFCIAIGFNDLMVTTFKSFPSSQHLLAKTIYLITMLGILLIVSDRIAKVINVV